MEEKRELDINISKYARDKTIEHLKHAFVNDMLEQDDFEKRLVIATSTNNKADLKEIVDDIPELKHIGQQQQTDTSISESEAKIVSVLGEVKKRGVWRPQKKMEVSSTLGAISLDFTKAVLSPGITEIDVKCVLGEVSIIVPEGIEVDAHCKAILASFNDKSKECENPDAPILKIRGYACLGEIQIRPPKQNILKKILKKFGLDLDY